jgi:membrane-associated protease RseP (regulator of RpoE activity)
MSNGQDPLQKFAGPLVAVLLALAASVFIAALVGGAMPLEYTGRALVYLGLLLYVIAGAVVVFRLTAPAEQAAALSAARVGKWVVSIWLWPLLLLGRRQR